MEKKDIACQIRNFLEKASISKELGTSKVELPEYEFLIIGIYNAEVDEDSLTEISNIWTFNAKAIVFLFDTVSKITYKAICNIVGNAVIEQAKNSQPTVLSVKITHIEIISKQLNESKQ